MCPGFFTAVCVRANRSSRKCSQYNMQFEKSVFITYENCAHVCARNKWLACPVTAGSSAACRTNHVCSNRTRSHRAVLMRVDRFSDCEQWIYGRFGRTIWIKTGMCQQFDRVWFIAMPKPFFKINLNIHFNSGGYSWIILWFAIGSLAHFFLIALSMTWHYIYTKPETTFSDNYILIPKLWYSIH